jgi:hypothetical protein
MGAMSQSNVIAFPGGYTVQQFESDIQAMQPRTFDTYILPAFMIYFAIKAKKPMGRNARRMLFTAGIYMLYRNYAQYKQLALKLSQMVKSGQEAAV